MTAGSEQPAIGLLESGIVALLGDLADHRGVDRRVRGLAGGLPARSIARLVVALGLLLATGVAVLACVGICVMV